MEFSIEHRVLADGAVFVTVEGSLDAHTFEKLSDRLNTLFAENRSRIIFDFLKMDYASSTGIGVLMTAYRTAKDRGGGLAFVGISDHVISSLEIMGLDEFVALNCNTIEEAQELLSS